MSKRKNALPCVKTTLRVALTERFRYPSNPPLLESIEKNSEDLSKYQSERDDAALIESLISQIESSSFNTIFNNPEITGDKSPVSSGSSKTSNISSKAEERLFRSYINMIAQFVVHISPAFYTGRHSFTFRDMLMTNSLPDNVTDVDVAYLWPEIYDQGYLSKTEYRMILDTREVEVAIAARGLQDLIATCCGNFGNGVNSNFQTTTTCSSQGILDKLTEGGIFEEGSSFVRAQQYVCFGEGQGCWNANNSNKIIIPCHANSKVCKDIPEDNIIKTFEKDDEQYFGLCVEYENFLYAFALDDRKGLVANPLLSGVNINKNVANQIRQKWAKEINMMRHYLDLNHI